MSLTFLDSTYKPDHTVFVLLIWLISLSISSKFIHIFTNDRIFLLFLRLNYIPLYIPHFPYSLDEVCFETILILMVLSNFVAITIMNLLDNLIVHLKFFEV
jgi:hypothetical protein